MCLCRVIPAHRCKRLGPHWFPPLTRPCARRRGREAGLPPTAEAEAELERRDRLERTRREELLAPMGVPWLGGGGFLGAWAGAGHFGGWKDHMPANQSPTYNRI